MPHPFPFLHPGGSRYLAALGVVVLLGTTPAPAVGQSSKTAESLPGTVSEDGLDSFAKSYVRLAEVRRSYAKRLEDAKGDEATKLQTEASEKTVEVLGDEGLSPDEYNRILAAVNSDEQLRKRALGKIEKERSP